MKSDCFVEKNHFLSSDQVQKMHLGHIAKNGPKTHNQVKYTFSLLDQKIKNCFFVKKNHFWFSRQVKRISFLPDNEFLAHFWRFDPDSFFGLDQKTRSDFFHKTITFYFLIDPF